MAKPLFGFEVEQHLDGTCDVTLERKAYHYDYVDLEEALNAIRRDRTNGGRGIEITVIEADGYRRKVRT